MRSSNSPPEEIGFKVQVAPFQMRYSGKGKSIGEILDDKHKLIDALSNELCEIYEMMDKSKKLREKLKTDLEEAQIEGLLSPPVQNFERDLQEEDSDTELCLAPPKLLPDSERSPRKSLLAEELEGLETSVSEELAQQLDEVAVENWTRRTSSLQRVNNFQMKLIEKHISSCTVAISLPGSQQSVRQYRKLSGHDKYRGLWKAACQQIIFMRKLQAGSQQKYESDLGTYFENLSVSISLGSLQTAD